VNSCLIPAFQGNGAEIVTIEGLAAEGHLQVLQQTFLECGGAQCGICTPGMILAAFHLLSKKPQPTLEEIRQGLSGNLCRCTGYTQIFDAVAEAGRRGGAT
jgi:carbon-monoxide dehydrogenase small subunit